jgi:sialate O-acetylesterase
MVVQRDRPVAVWGWADPQEKVTVRFRGQTALAVADPGGRWRVTLAPTAAGGPFDLSVSGQNTLTLRDVLVGDVWVGSGQSNMERRMDLVVNAEAEIAQARDDRIRLFAVPHKISALPLEDVEAPAAWAPTTPETVKGFSAVSYFFAREMRRVRDVPIGLVHSSWGGTPAEAWTRRARLESDPAFQPLLWQWTRFLSEYPSEGPRYERLKAEWDAAVADLKAEGKDVLKTAPRPPRGPGHPSMPGGLYDGMIAPLTPFTIRGVLWYQGEANAQPLRAREYRRLFAAMIEDWRDAWNEGAFPFLFVQLANYNNNHPRPTSPADSAWAELRESQALALALPNTGMAVTIDIGEADDIHPKNKQDVGKRLALAARSVADGEHLLASGPALDGVVNEGPRLRVHFRNVGGGLVAHGDRLVGFAVAGADRRFAWAEAKIDGDTVIVSSAEVLAPIAVRYAWADNPDANLYNREGLPAAPFRSDEWAYRAE